MQRLIKRARLLLLLIQAAGLSLGLALAVGGPICAAEHANQPLVYVATIPPLGMILRELAGGRAEVRVLLPPGASPHTFEPKPSAAREIAKAQAFFYCNELLDGWAANLGGGGAIEMFALVPAELKLEMPEHHHEHGTATEHGALSETERDHELDPHFWTSPRVVRALLPALVRKLTALDPGGAAEYQANAWRFDAMLSELDRELTGTLTGVQGEHLLLFHPSFMYLMHDYGLELAAVVEAVPGQEPTPQLLARLIELGRTLKLKAIFTEPQLPAGPAQAIARDTGLPLYCLDPLGGGTGRTTYAGLIRYNARVLADALGS
jgi:ABC-type Zn uptake system ZnuABC Zn-binding protein ZnuA